MHGAMVTGVLLFAVVGFFVFKPSDPSSIELTPRLIAALLALSLGTCALSLLLRRRVPRKTNAEPADAYWVAATPRAMMAWAPLEAGSLLAVYLSARTHSITAVAVAVVTVLVFITLNPGSLERR